MAPEEVAILVVGTRPAALDEGNADLVQPLRDAELILQREGYALALGAIAQGGVVDVDLSHRMLLNSGRWVDGNW